MLMELKQVVEHQLKHPWLYDRNMFKYNRKRLSGISVSSRTAKSRRKKKKTFSVSVTTNHSIGLN